MTQTRITATLGAVLCATLAAAPVVNAALPVSPLMEAVKSDDVTAVRTLIARKADVNAAEPDGTTALHWAADLGDVKIVDMLLTAGARLKVANRYGATPFGLAAAK